MMEGQWDDWLTSRIRENTIERIFENVKHFNMSCFSVVLVRIFSGVVVGMLL